MSTTNKRIYDGNWLIKPCSEHSTLIPFAELEDSSRTGDIKTSLEKKEKITNRLVCVERMPDVLSWTGRIRLVVWTDYFIKAGIPDLPDALNEVDGILMFPAELIPRDTHHVTVQSNSLNEQGDSRHCTMCRCQISLIKAVISHIILKVRAPQLVKPKWGKFNYKKGSKQKK